MKVKHGKALAVVLVLFALGSSPAYVYYLNYSERQRLLDAQQAQTLGSVCRAIGGTPVPKYQPGKPTEVTGMDCTFPPTKP